jgi:hypothetical protein
MVKVTERKSLASKETADETARKPSATTLYPKGSLPDALRLAESIRNNNVTA